MDVTDVAASDAELLPARRTLQAWNLKRWAAAHAIGPPVVALVPSSTTGEALSALAQHGITSAPVIDEARGEFVGFLSVSDVLRHLLRCLYPTLLSPSLNSAVQLEEKLRSNVDETPPSQLQLNEWARTAFLTAWCNLVRPGTDGDIVYSGFSETNLLDLVSRALVCKLDEEKSFGDFECGHRVGVFDEACSADVLGPTPATPASVGFKMTHVISQLDVVATLCRDPDSLGAFPAMTTLEQLGLVKEVATVPETLPAAAAFALMYNVGVSGAAVTDASACKIKASLSVSDLRRINSPDDFELLTLPILDFLKTAWKSAIPRPGDEPLSGPGYRAPVTLPPTTSLLKAMCTLAGEQVHRVWIVDAADKPVGVVTPSDIVRIFAVDPDSSAGKELLTW